jgi:hypothetical protein
MQQTARKAHSKAPPNTPALGVRSTGSIFEYIKQRLLEVLSARKESTGYAESLQQEKAVVTEQEHGGSNLQGGIQVNPERVGISSTATCAVANNSLP